MKVLVCLMLACLSLVSSSSLSCECGWRNSGRIVNGKETRKNEYPWMVSLSNGCGGSIITPWHILTAAHCTKINPSDLYVSVGMHYRYGHNENMRVHGVSRFIKHAGYVFGNSLSTDDIAIVVLSSPIQFNQFVGPVCLPSSRFDLLGKFIKVTGWGSTMGTASENALREVDLEVISNNVCKRDWPINSRPTQICAYTPKKDSCNGDSGGALVYLDPSINRYTQVALVSYGDPACGIVAKPSVNTDVFAYLDWIKQAIAQTQPSAQICTKLNLRSLARKSSRKL